MDTLFDERFLFADRAPARLAAAFCLMLTALLFCAAPAWATESHDTSTGGAPAATQEATSPAKETSKDSAAATQEAKTAAKEAPSAFASATTKETKGTTEAPSAYASAAVSASAPASTSADLASAEQAATQTKDASTDTQPAVQANDESTSEGSDAAATTVSTESAAAAAGTTVPTSEDASARASAESGERSDSVATAADQTPCADGTAPKPTIGAASVAPPSPSDPYEYISFWVSVIGKSTMNGQVVDSYQSMTDQTARRLKSEGGAYAYSNSSLSISTPDGMEVDEEATAAAIATQNGVAVTDAVFTTSGTSASVQCNIASDGGGDLVITIKYKDASSGDSGDSGSGSDSGGSGEESDSGSDGSDEGSIFTVTFDSNGGTGGTPPDDLTSEASGSPVVLPANAFTRTGYTANGWNTAADGSGTAYADGASVVLSSDLVLYAAWLPAVYHLSFSAEGAQSTPAARDNLLPTDADLLPTAAPERPGYIFEGWFYVCDGEMVQASVATTVAELCAGSLEANIALQARFSAIPMAIDYERNGATGGEIVLPPAEGDSGQRTVAQNNLTRPGYTALGWNTAIDGSGTSYAGGETITLDGVLTLYAMWADGSGGLTGLSAATGVAYAPNGATGGNLKASDAISKDGSTYVVAVNNYTRSGYTANGWNTAADGSGTAYAGGEQVSASEVSTLYAMWASDSSSEETGSGSGSDSSSGSSTASASESGSSSSSGSKSGSAAGNQAGGSESGSAASTESTTSATAATAGNGNATSASATADQAANAPSALAVDDVTGRAYALAGGRQTEGELAVAAAAPNIAEFLETSNLQPNLERDAAGAAQSENTAVGNSEAAPGSSSVSAMLQLGMLALIALGAIGLWLSLRKKDGE